MNLCPCRSGVAYSQCCEPYHLQKAFAPTPQALMRSRYSAYIVGAIDYIHKTYAPSCRANQSVASIKEWADSADFINLEFVDAPLNHTQSADKAPEGYVEFIASYIENGLLCKLHERSRFISDNQQWFYIDGKLTPHQSVTIGRNESCPCGSGKKFKRCHS